MILSIIIAAIICIVVPLFVGDLLSPTMPIGNRYILGIFGTLAVSQVLFIPFIVYQLRFTPFFIIYVLIIMVLCIVSIIINNKRYLQDIRLFFNIKDNWGSLNLWMLLALLLIGMQIVRVAIGQFFVYADNVRYIPAINDILETDLYYSMDYKWGVSGIKETDVKYIYTTYFPYLASICKISGLHPAILVQTVLPIILTLSLYNLVWHYGLFLFRNKQSSWIFVFFFSLLIETIGGYDYTYANHVVSGIYFGKKIVFTILLPFILLFIAERTSLLEDEVVLIKKHDIFLLLIMMTGVCAPSLMGTGLAPIILFSVGMVLSFRKKSMIPLILMGIAMIPSMVSLIMVIIHQFFSV